MAGFWKDIYVEPARMVTPGCRKENGTLIVSFAIPAAAEGTGPAGIRLYDPESGAHTDLPFTSEMYTGSVCSMKISGCGVKDPAYLYFAGTNLYRDPYCRRLVDVHTGHTKLTACGFSAIENDVPEGKPLAAGGDGRGTYSWNDRFIYLLHVSGFTRDASSGVKKRGTYAGVAEKIPYLKSLGVTTVELMPVDELCSAYTGPGAMEAECGYSVREQHRPEKLPEGFHPPVRKPNFWGYGAGYPWAPKAQYAEKSESAEEEFLALVRKFHEGGLEVILQMDFPGDVPASVIQSVSRYYVLQYGIDGIRYFGPHIPLETLIQDPVLEATLLLADVMPLDVLTRKPDYRTDNPWPRSVSASRGGSLSIYRGDYCYTLRRFVKGDDCALRPFADTFLTVPEKCGEVRYAAGSSGFTLLDLVSYSRKHNEENGEGNADGPEENCSWNCGQEGPSRKKEVLRLRKRLMRNFLALVFLGQGTPLLNAGDECLNSRGGNNNPYCQDNPTGWTTFHKTKEAGHLTDFVRKLAAFRKAHPVFRMAQPFRFGDYRNLGYPDVSFHGTEGWKADFSASSHSLGILYNEDYLLPPAKVREEGPHLLYLAVNMYWQDLKLGLPNLPKEFTWQILLDTAEDDPFTVPEKAARNFRIEDLLHVNVPARAILLLSSRRMTPEEEQRKTNAAAAENTTGKDRKNA